MITLSASEETWQAGQIPGNTLVIKTGKTKTTATKQVHAKTKLLRSRNVAHCVNTVTRKPLISDTNGTVRNMKKKKGRGKKKKKKGRGKKKKGRGKKKKGRGKKKKG